MTRYHDGSEETRCILDLRGLHCPLPVLRTRKALRALPAGRMIEVLCTDPLAGLDIPNLVRESGDEVVDVRHLGTEIRLLLRKGARCNVGCDRAGRSPIGTTGTAKPSSA